MRICDYGSYDVPHIMELQSCMSVGTISELPCGQMMKLNVWGSAEDCDLIDQALSLTAQSRVS